MELAHATETQISRRHIGNAERGPQSVPVAQLDKAPDYESGDWGFKSLQGYFFRLPTTRTAVSKIRKPCKKQVLPGIEPGFRDSESPVITVTLQDLMVLSEPCVGFAPSALHECQNEKQKL